MSIDEIIDDLMEDKDFSNFTEVELRELVDYIKISGGESECHI